MSTFYHTAAVYRESTTVANQAETFAGYSLVTSTLACLIEPMPAWRQATILGDISGGKFCVSWGTDALQDGDRIVWNSRKFTLQLNADDRYRPSGSGVPAYQTGTLVEEVAYRG